MKLNDLVEFLERMREESVNFNGNDNPDVTFYHIHIDNDKDVAVQTLEFKNVECAALTDEGIEIEL